MAKSNPLVPLVNIITQDPITGHIIDGEIDGNPSTLYSGAAYAGIFNLECTLRDSLGSGIWQMTGTVAVPAWSLMENAGDVPLNKIAFNTDATAGPLTITAAQMVDAWLDRDGGATNRSDTTPTAALLLAAVSGAVIGKAFSFFYKNASSTPGQIITLGGGTNVTFSGNVNVVAGRVQEYIGIFTAVGATPTVVLYAINAANGVLGDTFTASTVNTFRLISGATGQAIAVTPVGSDTNIGVKITPKGTGVVSVPNLVTAQVPNYIATESGANNAIAGALVDASSTAVPLAAGLEVVVKLGHTLQAGANTFNFNGGGAVNLKSSRNVANNIGTAYAATGVIKMLYDGTEWVDMNQ